VSSRARVIVALFAAGAGIAAHGAEPPRDALAEGFRNPPADARPLVFWQWVNGNVTEEGIRLDLEWMHRIGLAGAIMFDIGFRTPPVPQYVEKRVGFGSDEWRHAVTFAGAEAKRLGLLLGAQSSGGWSVSGDPGVRPEQAMKKLVWSETVVAPDSPQDLRLPPPPDVNGPYQDLPIGDAQFLEPRATGEVAVIAVKLPKAEEKPAPRATYSTPAGSVPDAELLDDGSYARAIEIAPDEHGKVMLTAHLPLAPDSITLGIDVGRTGRQDLIESSPDGVHYSGVPRLPNFAAEQPAPVITISTRGSTDLYWHIVLEGRSSPVRVREFRFDGARISHIQEKSGYGISTVLMHSAAPAPDPATAASDVIDVSDRMTAKGRLNWRPTTGRWVVLRFGWSLTGRRTVPATNESRGFEVDKLDAAAVRTYADGFFARYGQTNGGGPLSIAFTDSWEAGQQNWTPAMPEEFAKRRGYDLRTWLPVITGRAIGDAERSERFLEDFRQTLSELLVENHYGVLADVAHRRGMQYFAEAPGTGTPTVIDELAARRRVDVPTGEFWTWPTNGTPNRQQLGDVRTAASAAHIYGRTQVAAESLTSQGEDAWALGPAQLRRMMDCFFAEGVNRVILHTSAHQPFTDRVPGITLRQYGQHFTRNETWAEDAGAWIDYLARTSFLLQQGLPVTDVATFVGEDQPTWSDATNVPRQALQHDLINAEALLKLEFRDGQLVLPNGVRYRLLEISEFPSGMTLPVIRKLKALLEAGAVVVAVRKPQPLGLADEKEFRAIADGIWDDKLYDSELAWRPVGRGFLFSSVVHAADKKLLPLDVAGPRELRWTHRATDDTDIYFVSNQSGTPFQDVVKFRVRGRHVEIWNAVDGTRLPASYSIGDQTTAVHLKLEPFGSKFVVFRGAPVPGDQARAVDERRVLATLQGPWDVEFLDGRGAPHTAKLSGSWTDESNPSIRYYSGRARYLRDVEISADWLAAGRRIEMDLGEVAELAHVYVNGADLRTWWTPPFRGDISSALHAGRNRIEVVVTNYWVNRLIGDEQPGAKPWTFAPIRPYQANSPLRRSGLLGPVQLLGVGGMQ